MAMMHRDEGCNPLFGGFFPDGDVLRHVGNPLFGGVFAMAMHRDEGCILPENEVFVMRLFCVGFCKIENMYNFDAGNNARNAYQSRALSTWPPADALQQSLAGPS